MCDFAARRLLCWRQLADLIGTTRADALAVIGDRNMRNRTVQACFAKRKGRLAEVQLNDVLQVGNVLIVVKSAVRF